MEQAVLDHKIPNTYILRPSLIMGERGGTHCHRPWLDGLVNREREIVDSSGGGGISGEPE